MRTILAEMRGLWLVCSLAGAVLLCGCSAPRSSVASVPGSLVSEPDRTVILGPGDMVDVKFYYAPELNESQTIRPDGKITLQLVGEVADQSHRG